MIGAARQRLNQLDALRGLAAMAVVLFHFSTRFSELYPQAAPQAWSLSMGHLGVNLFFIISGFVIFMTIERTARPTDFVVSRVSRLYPAYWVAILLTFCITHALTLPGKTVPLTTALANGLMFHGFFRVPHVDGVYWTLEVELLFYALILALYVGGRLAKVHRVLLGLLAYVWSITLQRCGGAKTGLGPFSGCSTCETSPGLPWASAVTNGSSPGLSANMQRWPGTPPAQLC